MGKPLLLRRVACLVAASALLATQALATWSIVVVDRSTGEVCVASATCLADFPLRRWLAVVVPEKGGAAAQSAIDITGKNRQLIWKGLHLGWVPGRILDQLDKQDGEHQSRQYGIVAFDGAPVTFTGTGAGKAKHGVRGQVGDLYYAIQGNVLAGDAVVTEAEKALLNTPGDLGQRVMAAMEAARSMGGDGRCSCSQGAPDSCGSPPPNFTKSAHTAFIVLARHGDKVGKCFKNCANGQYYLKTEFNGAVGDPDPVIVLKQQYDAWRQGLIGVPDHVLSEVLVDRQELVADGLSRASVFVRLRDVDGTPLTAGGNLPRLVKVSPGPATARPGPVTDHGDGTYSFELEATTHPGPGEWEVWVPTSPTTNIQLFPRLVLETAPLAELHVGFQEFSGSSGGVVPFTLNLGSAQAGRLYHLLGSASGTSPGVDLGGGLILPLNRDHFFHYTWFFPGPPGFPGSQGAVDGDGRAEAFLDLPFTAWTAFIGERLDFATLLGGPLGVTNGVGFQIVP